MSSNLANPPSEIVRQVLIDLSLGSASGDWPVHYALEPDSPDNCITVYDTAGIDEGRVFIDGERQQHQGVTVRVRSAVYAVGYVKAQAIAAALDENVYRRTVTIDANAYFIQAFRVKGDVNALGRQTPISKRCLFTVNALVALRQTS